MGKLLGSLEFASKLRERPRRRPPRDFPDALGRGSGDIAVEPLRPAQPSATVLAVPPIHLLGSKLIEPGPQAMDQHRRRGQNKGSGTGAVPGRPGQAAPQVGKLPSELGELPSEPRGQVIPGNDWPAAAGTSSAAASRAATAVASFRSFHYPARDSARASRIVPVSAAAGLACGVFCGLLLTLGIPERVGSASRDPSSADPWPEQVGATAATALRVAPPAKQKERSPIPGPGPNAESALAPLHSLPSRARPARPGDPGPGDDALDAGQLQDESSRGEARLERRRATLTFRVKPKRPRGLVITVDGERVQGRTHEVELSGGKSRVTVEATARGYRRWTRRYTLRKDRKVRVELERPDRSPEGPRGLIDLP